MSTLHNKCCPMIFTVSLIGHIINWAYKWKIKFNLDITKQAIEVISSTEYNKENHLELTVNVIPVV